MWKIDVGPVQLSQSGGARGWYTVTPLQSWFSLQESASSSYQGLSRLSRSILTTAHAVVDWIHISSCGERVSQSDTQVPYLWNPFVDRLVHHQTYHDSHYRYPHLFRCSLVLHFQPILNLGSICFSWRMSNWAMKLSDLHINFISWMLTMPNRQNLLLLSEPVFVYVWAIIHWYQWHPEQRNPHIWPLTTSHLSVTLQNHPNIFTLGKRSRSETSTPYCFLHLLAHGLIMPAGVALTLATH